MDFEEYVISIKINKSFPPSELITYHEEYEAATGFNVETMRVPGEKCLGFLRFVVQQQRYSSSRDVPFRRCWSFALVRCHPISLSFFSL